MAPTTLGRFPILAFITLYLTLSLNVTVSAQEKVSRETNRNAVSRVWVSDNGDGTYKNPVLHADYSDPDVIRVGDDFYMTASSFNAVPGLPILHSKDLVNWTLVGHVFQKQLPLEIFNKPQQGNGVWAPSIRYHEGEFYIFYPDPDYGIYLVKAKNPSGPWSEPLLIKSAKGWIDPCPLWDSDGSAYLVNAMAASRSGIKSVLVVSRMAPDGTKLLDDGAIVFDGHDKNPTIEGPKFYKRNGYFYIFAPAGGVEQGWQLALRSRNVFGPYEERIVLAEGKSGVNGPHQGAWVDTQMGESWFLHFQDREAYGRVVHLQPLKWIDDWPVIGAGGSTTSPGEPVLKYKKPDVGRSYPVATPAESDEFESAILGLQWQWQANAQSNWYFPNPSQGFIRLFSVSSAAPPGNFWEAPNLLLQKFPAPEFSVTTKVTFTPRSEDDKVGLVIMGADYAYVSVRKSGDQILVSQSVCRNADNRGIETRSSDVVLTNSTFYLRARVREKALAAFSYSNDGVHFKPIGEEFTAKKGRWVGAKVGIFASGLGRPREMGYADFDWFRVENEK